MALTSRQPPEVNFARDKTNCQVYILHTILNVIILPNFERQSLTFIKLCIILIGSTIKFLQSCLTSITNKTNIVLEVASGTQLIF